MAVTREELESLTVGSAADQWREIMQRPQATRGQRQGTFVPVEQILSYGALFVVAPTSQGGSDWGRYHPVLRQIGAACRRSPASIANKGMNLMGIRPNSQKYEEELYAALGTGELRFQALYQIAMTGARAAGIEADALPDFLGLLGTLDPERELFMGEEELLGEDLDRAVHDYVTELDGQRTSRQAMADIRIGQSRFARTVLTDFDFRCGFCGLDGRPLAGHRLTVASHIKPWRDAAPRERLDPKNGIAACPTHDAAFDTGLMTIEDDGRVLQAGKLAAATSLDSATAHAFAVRQRLIATSGWTIGRFPYLAWHRAHIWINHVAE